MLARLTNRLVNYFLNNSPPTHLECRGVSKQENQQGGKISGDWFYKNLTERDERLICTYSTDVNQNASHARGVTQLMR